MRTYPVIIIGAGAAGIACADRLYESGQEFLLLEARSRIGGRIFSVMDEDQPLELGAEFVHGANCEAIQWLRRAHLPFYDVTDRRLFLQGRKLSLIDDYWIRINHVLSQLKPRRDSTVAEFLKKQRRMNATTKSVFQTFVEGFHTADLNIIGEAGLYKSKEDEDEKLNGSGLFHPMGRYDSILQRTFDRFASPDRYRSQTALKEIRWRRDHVEITCEQGPRKETVSYQCRKLVLTLPIGVLKSSTVQWDPAPSILSAVKSHFHMGHVQRYIFKFQSRFWEALQKDKPVAFLHTGPKEYFPSWWSSHPLRLPYLVAWQGGPKAREMAAWSDEERAHAALNTLSKLTKRSVKKLNTDLLAWHSHDWSNDPYSLGGYSYLGVGAAATAKHLQRPVQKTLYFAGEGTVHGPARATVHGALQSGQRAAQQLLKN